MTSSPPKSSYDQNNVDIFLRKFYLNRLSLSLSLSLSHPFFTKIFLHFPGKFGTSFVVMVRSLRWWSVESKEFALSVVGGATGIRIREKCKGMTRSILLDKDETAWLIKSFGELVSVQDSRVFWNQSVRGFPRILAQQCYNRHGYFLTVEEYEGRRRSGSIMVPKGRFREGWEKFGFELHLAFRLLHSDSTSSLKQLGAFGAPLVESNIVTRRSYAEVLRSLLPKLEESLSPFQAGPLAKGPGDQLKATVKTTSAKSVPPVMAGPSKAVRAPAFVPVAGLRKRAAGSSPLLSSPAARKPATRKSCFSDNLDFRSFRKMLESLLVDTGHYLSVQD
jgi:hypothetical protein